MKKLFLLYLCYFDLLRELKKKEVSPLNCKFALHRFTAQNLKLDLLASQDEKPGAFVHLQFFRLSKTLLEKSGTANELVLAGIEDTFGSFEAAQMSVLNLEDASY